MAKRFEKKRPAFCFPWCGGKPATLLLLGNFSRRSSRIRGLVRSMHMLFTGYASRYASREQAYKLRKARPTLGPFVLRPRLKLELSNPSSSWLGLFPLRFHSHSHTLTTLTHVHNREAVTHAGPSSAVDSAGLKPAPRANDRASFDWIRLCTAPSPSPPFRINLLLHPSQLVVFKRHHP